LVVPRKSTQTLQLVLPLCGRSPTRSRRWGGSAPSARGLKSSPAFARTTARPSEDVHAVHGAVPQTSDLPRKRLRHYQEWIPLLVMNSLNRNTLSPIALHEMPYRASVPCARSRRSWGPGPDRAASWIALSTALAHHGADWHTAQSKVIKPSYEGRGAFPPIPRALTATCIRMITA
jgi:hypothetical protein